MLTNAQISLKDAQSATTDRLASHTLLSDCNFYNVKLHLQVCPVLLSEQAIVERCTGALGF
jgi:hypothetical protein